MMTDVFLATHTQLLLAQHARFADFIRRCHQSTEDDVGDDHGPILSAQAVQQAQHCPFSAFFQQSQAALARCYLKRLALVIAHDDQLEKLRDRPELSPCTNTQYLANHDSIGELDRTIQLINQSIDTHYAQWTEFLQTWGQHTLDALNKLPLSLNRNESEQFWYADNGQALFAQCQDHHLTALLPFTEPTCDQVLRYYQAKTLIVAQLSLSRQHQPHDADAIKSLVKPLKKHWRALEQAETDLIKQQQATLDDHCA